jgi:hypothetical protein
MTNLRTPEEITAEIATLRAMKPDVRRYTLFRDDNHAAIEAQIALLEEPDPEDAFADYAIEDGEHAYFAAQEVIDWLTGENDDAPSISWAELVVA